MLLSVLILALAETLFLYFSYQSLYGGVEQAMESRFSTFIGRLQATGTAGDTSDTSASRSQALRRAVEQFDEKDKFEFMLLDDSGFVLSSSSGTINQNLTNGTDFYRALNSATGVGRAIFRTPDGERVMAVTTLVPYAAGGITAMRLVTSLTLADRQWRNLVLLSAGVVVAVLAFTLWSGLFFVRSIVRPLAQVEATANRIARGELETRLPEPRYNDEIGRMCRTINEMAEHLGETAQTKNELISSVSHERRTTLTSIKGWVETLAAIHDPDDENYRKGLSVIGAEADRLYAMVEELLDFSRLQNGIKLECQVLDLVAEVTDAALFIEGRIRQEGLRLIYEEPPEPYPVWADPGRLRQVLVNVLDNAVKYSPPGGSIFLTLRRAGAEMTVTVRDQGRGISPEDLEHVKQKFFKGRNAVRGSGIGLAVVDSIVTAFGGRVDIASTLGQGTTVSIVLPAYHPGQEALHRPI